MAQKNMMMMAKEKTIPSASIIFLLHRDFLQHYAHAVYGSGGLDYGIKIHKPGLQLIAVF
jgi:hypothetical protein